MSIIKITLMLKRNFQIFFSINIIILLKVIKVIQNTVQMIVNNIEAALIFKRIFQISSASYIMILLISKLESVDANIIDSNTDAVELSFDVFMNDVFMIDIVSESVNYENEDDDNINILTDDEEHNKNENINL